MESFLTAVLWQKIRWNKWRGSLIAWIISWDHRHFLEEKVFLYRLQENRRRWISFPRLIMAAAKTRDTKRNWNTIRIIISITASYTLLPVTIIDSTRQPTGRFLIEDISQVNFDSMFSFLMNALISFVVYDNSWGRELFFQKNMNGLVPITK